MANCSWYAFPTRPFAGALEPEPVICRQRAHALCAGVAALSGLAVIIINKVVHAHPVLLSPSSPLICLFLTSRANCYEHAMTRACTVSCPLAPGTKLISACHRWVRDHGGRRHPSHLRHPQGLADDDSIAPAMTIAASACESSGDRAGRRRLRANVHPVCLVSQPSQNRTDYVRVGGFAPFLMRLVRARKSFTGLLRIQARVQVTGTCTCA